MGNARVDISSLYEVEIIRIAFAEEKFDVFFRHAELDLAVRYSQASG